MNAWHRPTGTRARIAEHERRHNAEKERKASIDRALGRPGQFQTEGPEGYVAGFSSGDLCPNCDDPVPCSCGYVEEGRS